MTELLCRTCLHFTPDGCMKQRPDSGRAEFCAAYLYDPGAEPEDDIEEPPDTEW